MPKALGADPDTMAPPRCFAPDGTSDIEPFLLVNQLAIFRKVLFMGKRQDQSTLQFNFKIPFRHFCHMSQISEVL